MMGIKRIVRYLYITTISNAYPFSIICINVLRLLFIDAPDDHTYNLATIISQQKL